MTVLFFAVQALIPGDYVTQYVLSVSVEDRAELREDLGIDIPIWQQYFLWLKRMLTFDLGKSLSGFQVIDLIKWSLPPTLLVFGIGTVIAFWLGEGLGRMTGWRGSGLVTSSVNFFSILFFTSFPPWFGFLVVYLLQERLRSLFFFFDFKPSYDIFWDLRPVFWADHEYDATIIMWKMVLSLAAIVFIVMIIRWGIGRLSRRRLPKSIAYILIAFGWIGSWSIQGFSPQGWDVLFHITIPVTTYVLLAFGETMIIMQTSMADTLDETYITTARAKGISEIAIRDKHAARNAVLPVLSRLVISLPYIIGGIVIIERSIEWVGMSASLTWSLALQDMPAIMGFFILIGLITAISRVVLDVAHAYLDPRIRFSRNL